MTLPAIFLDRDGVLNEKKDNYVKNEKELIIYPKTVDALIQLKKLGYILIIITNQSVINRKIISKKELDGIHSSMLKYYREYGCEIDGIYYCPHIPSEKCSCRKPEIGMILQAVNDFHINLMESWMIGDSEIDIEAGKRAGCKCILTSGPEGLINAVKLISKSSR